VLNGDIYEVTFHSHLIDQRGIIRRYYMAGGVTGTGPTESAIGIRFDTAIPTPLKACMVVTAGYRGVKIAKVFPTPRQRAFTNTTSAGPGTVAGDALPTQVRGLITLRTALAGPGARGRVYVPFPGDADNGPSGAPIAGYVTRLIALANALDDTQAAIGVAGNQADLIPIIWHLPKNTPNLPGNREARIVTESLARSKWATQRRSGAYGRLNVDELV